MTEKFVIQKDSGVKDEIKAFAKELEDSGLVADLVDGGKYGKFSMLHAMFYCYLEPVSKLLNKKMQTALVKITGSADIQSYDSFVKNGGKQGEKKSQKDI